MRGHLLSAVIMLMCQGALAQDGTAPVTYSAVRHDVLDPVEFKAQLASAPGTLVDVRTPEECAEGIITGALMVDYNAPDLAERIKQVDPSKPVYIYCAAGGRAYKVAQYLLKNGYGYVVELNGGIEAWLEAGQTVVPPGSASNR